MLEALEEKFPTYIAWKILSYCRHPIAELLDEPIAEWMIYQPESYKGLLQLNHYIANKFIYSSLLIHNPRLVYMFPDEVFLTALPMIVPHAVGDFQFMKCVVAGVVHEFWRYRGRDMFVYSRRYIISRPHRSKCVSN